MRTNSRSIPWTERRRGIVAATAFALAFGAAQLLPIKDAFATHEPLKMVKGTFPNHGFIWLDDVSGSFTNGLWVYSDRCKPEEATTWSKIKSQLAGGQSQFRGAWPRGIYFYAGGCTATVDQNDDIMLDYMTSSEWLNSGHGSYGGHHHYSMGSSSWCAIWGVPYPCGYHISRIHINEGRYAGYSSSYRVNFLLHETGHSMGFNDYCTEKSITNNGASCLFSGGWQAGDKKVLRDTVYKNSPVYP
jgi:hypothetical protein